MKKYLFIANAKAGKSKHNQKAIREAVRILEANNIKYKWKRTKREGHALKLAKKAVKKDYQMVVAVGGDGTINEVASGLAGSQMPLGIIPVGSGNGFARHLKVPLNPTKAIASMLQHKNTLDVDLWNINNRYFLSIAGIGFDAFIAHEMGKLEKRGRWQYARLVLQKSLSYKPTKIKISVDDKEIETEVLMVNFANSCQFGNNICISPSAKINDGLLDIVLVKPFEKVFYPIFGLATFLGTPEKFAFYQHLRGKSITIHSASSEQIHIDGEPLDMELPIKIKLHEKQVRISIP